MTPGDHRGLMVGAPGFEPGTSCSQSRREQERTRMSYESLPNTFED